MYKQERYTSKTEIDEFDGLAEKLAADLRRNVRQLENYPILSDPWFEMAETFGRMATISDMESTLYVLGTGYWVVCSVYYILYTILTPSLTWNPTPPCTYCVLYVLFIVRTVYCTSCVLCTLYFTNNITYTIHYYYSLYIQDLRARQTPHYGRQRSKR
mmetsp:Transcript_24859/g.55841  ORF Transcript_24859/g.55841 Transcript_24859/m.55841 type:complete len:158 (+) Transcript_24859:131-604(+)